MTWEGWSCRTTDRERRANILRDYSGDAVPLADVAQGPLADPQPFRCLGLG